MGLTEIANRHNCDKGTQVYEKHSYTLEYEKYIPPSGEYNLLEIGVWHGDSLRMWKEYNPAMKIWGLDNDPGVLGYVKPIKGVKVVIGSQNNYSDLMAISEDAGSFRFIIDDGSHYAGDIFVSFINLFHFIEPNGIYFVEDLHFQGSAGVVAEITNWLNEQDWLVDIALLCNGKLLMVQKWGYR